MAQDYSTTGLEQMQAIVEGRVLAAPIQDLLSFDLAEASPRRAVFVCTPWDPCMRYRDDVAGLGSRRGCPHETGGR